MKVWPVLFGISLAANAALLIVSARSGSSSHGTARVSAAGGGGGTAPGDGARSGPAASRGSGPATGEGAAIAAALNLGDPEALRDELRAAGVEEDLIRAMVSARIWKRYEERMRALQPQPDPDRPWWKNDESGGYWGAQSREQREASRALQAELKAERERVLGPDPAEETRRNNSWMAQQSGYVAAEKWEQLQQLEQDYNELSNELRRDTRGFQMPDDAEQARFLQEEKRRDLAAFLSPEELAAYDRRQSRTAQNLRWQMTQMDASEAEFLAIFEIRKDFDERFASYDNFGNRMRSNNDPEFQKSRTEAEKAMRAQIKEALGPERYKAYVRSNEHDYQQLQNATKRFGLPAETPARVFDLRDEVPQAAARIADDVNLTPEEKKAAVAKLAADTRDQVRSTLGDDVAKVFFENNGMQWLRQLEGGTIITFDENGGQSHRRLDQPARK